MNVDGLRLSVYFGDSQTTGGQLTSDVLMDAFAARDLALATLFRGLEGFGIGRRIHTVRFPDISTDLPLLAVAIDARERIEATLDDVDRVVQRGLVTLENVRLVAGPDLAEAELPSGPGRAGTLTVYCGRSERAGRQVAYRAIVDLLRRQGAAGATVLLGVDGLYRGRRERAGLFRRSGNVPTSVVSVGSDETLRRILPLLDEVLSDPVTTLEDSALVKHDGELLGRLPSVPGSDDGGPEIWQAVQIYTRQSAQVHGRALYAELTRRLREAGGAGVTTLRGEWGFSSDERPHGDRFGTLSSHMPTYTVYVDRPDKVGEVWPIIDEVTAEHGIVTSALVPAYRERAGEVVRGRLELAERELFPPTEEARPSRNPASVSLASEGTAVERADVTEEALWLRTLAAQVAEFTHSRGVHEPLVRITLADGEAFFVASAEARPGGGFLTLYPHPPRHADLVQGSEGELVAPRAVVVALSAISKIELLSKAPRGTRSLLGFRLPDHG